MYVCASSVCLTKVRRVSSPLGLELEMAARQCVGAEERELSHLSSPRFFVLDTLAFCLFITHEHKLFFLNILK